MATFSIPNDKGFQQPNSGDSQGNVYMTYGIDFETQKGRTLVSQPVKKLLTDADNADFDGYAGSIGAYSSDGFSGEIFAVSDKVFSANFGSPLGTWTEETGTHAPDSGNTIMDSAFFDGLFLVITSNDIKAWNGTAWSSWWQGTAGQTALTVGQRKIMWVGADGNLFLTDGGNKVFRVTPTGTVSKTGNGTLDFSATQYEITCAATNSTRSWIGTADNTGKEAVIIEWDMSPSSATANKLHPMGAKAVRCIAVWNDTPIAVLSDGKVKYFNGVSFVEFQNTCQFPVTDGYQLSDDFIHPNGWAIIDDLPHFLVMGAVAGETVENAVKKASYKMPSGGWCLDPSIGLYHRFAIGTGATTQDDYGKMQVIAVGALYSLQRTDSKFLASYEYLLDETSTRRSVLAYHDASNTRPSTGFLITPFAYSLRDAWNKVEMFHKELKSGEKLRVYYRNKKREALALSGTWVDTKTFNVEGSDLGVENGDVAFIKTGKGSGQLLKIKTATQSTNTLSLTFETPNTFVSNHDEGTIDVLNFRFMGEVTSTTEDYKELAIPETAKKRKMQFLFEFQQNANNTMELDFGIINT